MLGQTRHSGRLLRTVNNKPHATQNDYYDPLPTPPPTNSTRSSGTLSRQMTGEDENDLTREPESSDDGRKSPIFRHPKQRVDGLVDEARKKPRFSLPTALNAKNNASDGERGEEVWHMSSDGDDMVFNEQPIKRRRKAAGVQNIHAKPFKTFGKAARRHGAQTASKDSKQTANAEEAAPAGPKFQRPKGLIGMFEFGKSEPQPTFKEARRFQEDGNRSTHSDSPSLSSLSEPPSSPEVQEIQSLDLPEPQTYTPMTECTICGRDVDKFLRESFEDEVLRGNAMTYKWQQRFCRHHRRHEARQIWEQRGYPDIDWQNLERRMRRHHGLLKDVMSNARKSYHRDVLSERLKERSKTLMQNLNTGAKKGANVGYYGPRGEKLMTDHILTHLSDHLREQAAKDNLVAASGVSGGVSGFIHNVLVPELAEQLVKEDMRVNVDAARELIVQSAELGELLHPDLDDKVTAEPVCEA